MNLNAKKANKPDKQKVHYLLDQTISIKHKLTQEGWEGGKGQICTLTIYWSCEKPSKQTILTKNRNKVKQGHDTGRERGQKNQNCNN